MGETPAKLREPPAFLSQLPMPELRPKIIFPLERGNTQPSPFLRVTSQVETCVEIWQERRYLYQPVMVRFPKNA
eukprot:11199740-Lingulodinium_polyedra.AAC.1